LNNYNNFNNGLKKISGQRSFEKPENLLKEGVINAQNRRDIKFVYYAKKSQLRGLFDEKNP
jgi:hypothetical protein